MNNTHKLLLAFIEASGYEVEENQTYDKESHETAIKLHRIKEQRGGGPIMGGTGTSPMEHTAINYKVTKKAIEIPVESAKPEPTYEERLKEELRKNNYETALDAEFGAGIISESEYMAAKNRISRSATVKACE